MRTALLRLLGALLVVGALGFMYARAPDLPVEALVQRWAPPPSDFIDVKGQLVHVRDEGPRHAGRAGEPLPVVLIHGTAASLHTWEGWAAALRGERRVISFDLPGFGLTGPNAAGDYRGETYASFVLDLLDALGVEHAVLAGNSLGGEIAWRTALRVPQRVERLVLVDAAGHAFEPDEVPQAFIVARIPLLGRVLESLLPRSMVDSSLRNVYGDPSRVTPQLVDRYFSLALREGNRHALLQRLQQADGAADAQRIRELRVPTLILWGGRDRLIPLRHARAFARDIAGSRLEIFDDLGHVPHEEDPQRTAAVVKRFLAAAATP